MQERHPIDERFKALYDAEAIPPEAVHEALAEQLGWSNEVRGGGAWRPLLIAAMGLTLFGAAYWVRTNTTGTDRNSITHVRPTHAHSNSTPTPRSTLRGVAVPQEASTLDDRATGPGGRPHTLNELDQTNSVALSDHEAEDSYTGPAMTQTKSGAGSAFVVNTNSGYQNSTSAERRPTDDGTVADPNVRAGATDHRNTNISSAEHPGGTTGSVLNTTPNDIRANRIDAIQVLPVATSQTRQPLGRLPSTDYVLPAGAWWIGPYAGMGAVNGQWKGEDANALQQAEKWGSTGQFGVLGGRAWRSGWGVSAGIGLASVHSTFHHETLGETRTITDIDTAWSQTVFASTGDILYTWTIDSLVGSVPGDLMRADAGNQYLAVQVPLQIQWHGDLRRVRYGAFGGITAWIPTQRQGLTLMPSQADASPTTLALQDARVDDRFTTQMHGQVGLSLGYSITEYLSAYAEPMVSTPLFSFGGGSTPWLTRPVLQLRLQHEFRSKPK